MNKLRFDFSFWIRVSPFDGRCRFIVLTDVAHQFGPQVGKRVKDPASDDMALNFREPVFHLVQPRGICRRIVNADIIMCLKKGRHELGLMRREVVGNDMDCLARGLRGDNLSKEAHKFGAGVAFGGLAKDFSTLRFQSGIERKRAVSKIFKTMRFGPSRRKRQNRIKAVQSLDGTLFIDTKDHGVSRRVQVEADDVRRLGFKVWVITYHVVTQTMRLQPVTIPDPGHGHVRRSQFLGQAAATPLGRAIIGSTPRPLQDTSFQLGSIFGRPSALMPGHQAVHALRTKPSGPPLNIGGAARQIGGRLAQAPSASQFQYDAGPLAIISPNTPRSHSSLQFDAFGISKNQWFVCHS